jgi:hypothetical protein
MRLSGESGECFAPTSYAGAESPSAAPEFAQGKHDLCQQVRAEVNTLLQTDISQTADYLGVEYTLVANKKKKAVLMLKQLELHASSSGTSETLAESATVRGLMILGANMKKLMRGELIGRDVQADELAPGDHCRSSGDVAEDEFSPALFPHLRS